MCIRDSAGEVQRMSAGSGIVHSEINQTGDPCRLLQIWIEPAQLGIQPAYEQKPFAIGEGWTPLIEPDATGDAMAIERPVRLWREAIRKRSGASARHQILCPEMTGSLPNNP